MDISVIIPAFNEQERIAPTIQAIDTFLAAFSVPYEIVVVDDGSSDGTVTLVESLTSEITNLRCIATKNNRGKGHAVRMGMLNALGQVRVMYDADGSMPPEEMPKLLTPIFEGKTEIAIGSRYAEGSKSDVDQPRWRVIWSRLANKVIQRSLVAGIRDTQCGFKAFSAQAAQAVFSKATIDGWSFDLEILGLASRMSYSIHEVGVEWNDDDRSRINPLQDFIRVVREFLTIRGNFRRNAYGLGFE